MAVNIIIGVIIFGYAGFALFRFINKSKQGKCASCAVKNSCNSSCSSDTIHPITKNKV